MSLPSSWRLAVAVLLICGCAVGYMEQLRRTEVNHLNDLKRDLQRASVQANGLRAREAALVKTRAERTALERRLLDEQDGAYYRQIYMSLIEAGRSSGVRLDGLTFKPAPPVGTVRAVQASGPVVGTEAQLLHFFRLLEEGRPVTRLEKIALQWRTGPATSLDAADSGGTATGNAAVELVLFGPIQTQPERP